MTVVPYSYQYKEQWDSFVRRSKNGTFLLQRDFAEYHSDRFQDASVLVFQGQELLSVFIANRVGDKVYSHQGLTYGGLILPVDITYLKVEGIFQEVLNCYKGLKINTIEIKELPTIYTSQNCDELSFLAFKHNAEIFRKDITLVVDLDQPLNYSKNKKRNLKYNDDFEIEICQDFTAFWEDVLIPNLNQKFGVSPVHSLEEIHKLRDLFPEQISLYTIKKEGVLVGGTVLFKTAKVIHAQYIAANPSGKSSNALDFLFDELLTKHSDGKRFFNFGIVNEDEGKTINEGLLRWKEGFGARTCVHNFYRFSL